tara:strand:+ start:2915 stop:3553 length:639 start_codon:yes stop_codon:yes gene_type:complete
MCGRYELRTEFEKLPKILKQALPNGFEKNYEQQTIIKPQDPVIVIKNEGKVSTVFMLWGFVSEWAKNPFAPLIPKPFNARAETIGEKKLFRDSWRHRRCLIPASGFFEKGNCIKRKDFKTFWLAGIWNKWTDSEGSELETCCVLTTEPNNLIKQFHNRMPVIVPYGLEEMWMAPVKSEHELKELKPILNRWDDQEWFSNPINSVENSQLNLF